MKRRTKRPFGSKCFFLHMAVPYGILNASIEKEDFLMKHVKTLTTSTLKTSMAKGGCGECQTSCQSACKTSCGVANQKCEKSL